jgi:hypothetical protein
MNADVLGLLHAADPAEDMPDTAADDRERLRRTIIASPADGPKRGWLPRPRRRLLLAVIVVGAIVLLGVTAVYAARVIAPPLPPLAPPPTPDPGTLMTARQVHAEYRLWTHKIELPPGVKWRREQLGKGGEGSGDTYGGNTGVMDAITWAWCAWGREWIAAAKAHDEVRVAAAANALDRLRSVMPEWHEGMTENQGGWDSGELWVFDVAIADAKQGDLETLRQTIADWIDQ